jgi:hypothetical protein
LADFLIWGRIEHLGPGEFLAIASAVPAGGSEGADVLTALMPSNDAAIRALLLDCLKH